MKVNYHTHTVRCRHASGSEREYIETALARGLTTLGFSDHSPYVFEGSYYSGFRMKPEELDDYCAILTALREEYKGRIDIKIGLEAEYYPRFFDKFLALIKPYPIDYLILGQHFSDNEFDGRGAGEATSDSARLTNFVSQLIAAIETGKFTYIAHPDMFNFKGDINVYKREISRLIVRAKGLGVPLELNMLGIRDHRHYPNVEFWKLVGELGCEAVIGCDAHEPQSVAEPVNIAETRDFAARCGVTLVETPLVLRKP